MGFAETNNVRLMFWVPIIIIVIIIYLLEVDLIYNNFVYNKYNKKIAWG